MLESLWQDARYALRGMRRSPVFAAVAVVSLALGIGANTAIFSLISALILRPLPVEHPGQLVEFLVHYPGDPALNNFSWASYEHFRDNSHAFSALTGMNNARFNVRGDALEPEVVDGAAVVGNFFQVLGLKPAIGRLIAPEDSAAAVISWPYWRSRFNRDPAIIGKKIVVDDAPLTIVGVTPRDFSGLRAGVQTDVWTVSRKGSGSPSVVARMWPGVSIAQARAEMDVLFRFTLDERVRSVNGQGSRDPRMRELTFSVEPAGAGLSSGLRDRFSKPLLSMMAVVALLLLIACTNVASMLLARGAVRQRELAVRLSLGAGRWRLVRQVLTESLLLSGAGGLLGILVAWFGATALLRIIRAGRPIIGMPAHIDLQVSPDAYVLLFTAGAALLTGLLFGLAPAWNAFHSAPAGSLSQSGRGGETRMGRLFGKGLIVAQVALSVGLLSAAGLFVGHLSNLEHLDLGFRRDHVLLVRLDRSRSGYTPEQLFPAYQELLHRLETIPGVRSATIVAPSPLSGAGMSRFITVQGHPERPEDRRYTRVSLVAPKSFETLGTPLLAGRDFTFEDRGRQRVAIVNQSMAQYYFGNVNPIGQHLTIDPDADPYEIIGVAGDANYYEIQEPAGRAIYINAFQWAQPMSEFAIRTSVEPESVATAVRGAVHDLLKTVPVARVATLEEQVDGTIVPERLIATLSGLFGGLGSLLVAIGIYGLLAYTVARRINEIGIRMALGATQSNVFRMVLGEALLLSCGGLLFGVPIAYWSKRFAGSLITDLPVMSAYPLAFGAATTIAVALVAASLPARRASCVDPMVALRYE
jgi:predicted permease